MTQQNLSSHLSSINRFWHLAIGILPYLVICLMFIAVTQPKPRHAAIVDTVVGLVAIFFLAMPFLPLERLVKLGGIGAIIFGTLCLCFADHIPGLGEVLMTHGGIIVISETSLMIGYSLLTHALRHQGLRNILAILTLIIGSFLLVGSSFLFGPPLLYFLYRHGLFP